MFNTIIKIDKDTPKDLIPYYATEGASGADIMASEAGVIKPHAIKLIKTGVRLEIPIGFEVQVRPRSGLSLKHGVTVLNAPGTIDSDYRGEVCVILINHSDLEFEYKRGDRIAQLVVARYEKCIFERADELSETERGDGGFGHSGISKLV